MNIGTVSVKSGLPAKTIRYYEDIGLIRPDRRDNGYRDYSMEDVHFSARAAWASRWRNADNSYPSTATVNVRALR